LYSLNLESLASNRVDGRNGLPDASRHARDDHVDDHGKKSGEESGERIVHAAVLLNLDDLVNGPTNDVHPGKSRGEGETSDDGVEGLSLELTGDREDGIDSDIGRHLLYAQILFW